MSFNSVWSDTSLVEEPAQSVAFKAVLFFSFCRLSSFAGLDNIQLLDAQFSFQDTFDQDCIWLMGAAGL